MLSKPEAGGNDARTPFLGLEMIGGAMLLLGFGVVVCSSVGWVWGL